MNRSLKDRIKARIASEGPLTVAQYMAACLSDPESGYYATREPFGPAGDFVTAPEISQMFGELVGAACLSAYQTIGAPEMFQLVELGPGRGTLMRDVLRIAKLHPDFLHAARLNLVETSPRLRTLQTDTLSAAPLAPHHHDALSKVPEGPVILIANEFFDALPIHQFIKTADGWHERQIGLDADSELTFGAGTARLSKDALPKGAFAASEGAILETQPAANAIAQEIGTRLAAHGGAAILIDYGYEKTAPGDTFQAVYKHAYDDVLAHPGEADLTAHVNFEALAAAATAGGATAHPLLTQGDFLLRSGLLERAGALGSGKSAQAQEDIRNAVERLAAPDQMGNLFKVLALTGNKTPFPPFDMPTSTPQGFAG